MLAEAVDVGILATKGGGETDVLRLENEGLIGGIEDGFLSLTILDGEGEGVRLEFELKIGTLLGGLSAFWTWER